jgi:hypothetical protein
MVSVRLWNRMLDLRPVQIRIPALPGIPRIPSRSLGGIAGLIAAITLGILAHQASRTEALGRWKRESAPSPRVWLKLLTSMDYALVRDPGEKHVALRSLPMSLDSQASVWWTRDLRWIAIYPGTETDPEPAIYRRSGTTKERPNGWDLVGIGWDALPKIAKRLEELRPPERPAAQPARPARDPRELVY